MARAPLPPLPPDVEVARSVALAPITQVAAELGLAPAQLEPYGHHKAKIRLAEVAERPARAKLILVTAMTATRAGAGKTVTSIGLAQALRHVGEQVALCLREPSLGPTFGIKGGAAGGGRAQVVPMEDINLHFTGDLHAITSAHNLLAAVVDNHAYFESELGIDPQAITWRRVLDLCDRQLRSCEIGRGGKAHGFVHETGFDITASSEIMAIMALARDRDDLIARLGRIVVARGADGRPVTAEQTGCVGALAVLLVQALDPNLVQTLEHGPALVHCGPFANIAHGCNSLVATRTGLALADWVVTEAGFAADLGAEKFLHLKAPLLGTGPAAAVLVVNARALKMHGGVAYERLAEPDVEAVERGFPNVATHIENLGKFGCPVVVAINRFGTDSDAELDAIQAACARLGARAEISEVAHYGGAGGVALAQAVMQAAAAGNRLPQRIYQPGESIPAKLEALAREIYRADGVEFSDQARADLAQLERDGFGELPICVAKTQHSISDDANKLGAPTGYKLQVGGLRVSAGAGFVVARCGSILLMPGMPRDSAVFKIGLDAQGQVFGLS